MCVNDFLLGFNCLQSPTQQEALTALKKRLEETTILEFPRHRLRMLSKLSEGAFGTVSYMLPNLLFVSSFESPFVQPIKLIINYDDYSIFLF